jgi:hypothetical protein
MHDRSVFLSMSACRAGRAGRDSAVSWSTLSPVLASAVVHTQLDVLDGELCLFGSISMVVELVVHRHSIYLVAGCWLLRVQIHLSPGEREIKGS